jgi:hypothetical protein
MRFAAPGRQTSMEEDKLLPTWSARSMKYSFLLLSLFLVLAACSEGPTAEDRPTVASIETIESTATSQGRSTVSAPSAPPSEASYLGIHFTYDEEVLGLLRQPVRQPAAAQGQGQAQPEYIEFSFANSNSLETARVLIFPVAQYEALSKEASVQINTLRELLSDPLPGLNRSLPLLPLFEATEIFHTEPTYVSFQNGRGISYVTKVNLDSGSAVSQPLLYAYQGLTADDSFYVSAIVPLSENENSDSVKADNKEKVKQIANKNDMLGAELQAILPLLDSVLSTLTIAPGQEFPSPAPPVYTSFPGVIIAHDPEFNGEVGFEKKPAIWNRADGSSLYLEGVPDRIQLSFENSTLDGQPSTLSILPVRGDRNQFFEGIPTEVQSIITDLETRLSNDDFQPDDEKALERMLTFHSGLGIRRIQQGSAPDDSLDTLHLTYHFEGITEDGRYYVQFNDPVHLTGSIGEVILNANARESADFLHVLSQLDSLVQSLTVSSKASVDSSIPANPPDCTNDAQFVSDVTIPDHSSIERGQTFVKTWLVRNTGTCSWTPNYKIVMGGGNPLTWSNEAILEVVPPEQETEISIKLTSPAAPGNYQAWWQLADEHGKPFGASFYVQFEAPPPATDVPGYGVVEGEISYPAGGMPAMTLYFLRTDGSQRYALETEEGWTHYANEIPAGEYYVFARVTGDESESGGGYTEAALCEFMCEDHTLVVVMVEEGKATGEINVSDWYAPAGTFPLPNAAP